jgi:hypothetical protein
MDVAEWLRGLGLEQYAPGFCNNNLDREVLHRLTAEDLRELGVASVGIAGGRSTPSAHSAPRRRPPRRKPMASAGS